MTKIIDCTLRDGGFLYNWSFEKDFVIALYNAAIAAGTDIFECGYRNFNLEVSQKPFYSCNDSFLFELFSPVGKTELAVMADVGKSDLSLFKKCTPDKTPVSLVRIAVYPDSLPDAFHFCEGLKNLDYNVILNLMAFGKYSHDNLKTLEKWTNKDILKSVCFADSFGAFYPEDIVKNYDLLKNIGFNNISFHAHNNLQLAFANSMLAVDNNFYSIDASVCGIGRSGGILPVELITGCKIFHDKYTPLPYLNFICRFMPNEGNVKAIIGGLLNIHPNYVNDIFEKYGNDVEKIWNAAIELQKRNLISYKK